MKYLNKIVLIVMLLSSISASAQISEIPFNPFSEQFVPKIKWDENRLMVSHSAGIFYQDYSTGELHEDWGRENHKWELYGFNKYEINEFVINGDKIIGSTGKSHPYGHLFVRSNDGGKTYEEFTPEIIVENLELAGGIQGVKVSQILQNPENKDELLAFGIGVYHSLDFGETWEAYYYDILSFFDIKVAKSHPADFNLIIVGTHSLYDYFPNGYFRISTDGGKTFEEIKYDGNEFYLPYFIAFHRSNPDIMLISGSPIVKTIDRGKSWEVVKSEFAEEELSCVDFDFDVRGSDRLYGFRKSDLLYSDDFGATWTELCEIGLAEDDYVADFVQHGSKIYTYSKNYKVHEIDLELLESAIEEVSTDASDVAVSIANGTLQVVSQSQISTIEVFNIGGVKMQSIENAGSLDISDLAKGTYVARVSTSDGKTISRKFNK